MHFQERTEGPFHIYAGAREARPSDGTGYIGAVVVHRRGAAGGGGSAVEAFRDEEIACGHLWPSAAKALDHAFGTAMAVIVAITQVPAERASALVRVSALPTSRTEQAGLKRWK